MTKEPYISVASLMLFLERAKSNEQFGAARDAYDKVIRYLCGQVEMWEQGFTTHDTIHEQPPTSERTNSDNACKYNCSCTSRREMDSWAGSEVDPAGNISDNRNEVDGWVGGGF